MAASSLKRWRESASLVVALFVIFSCTSLVHCEDYDNFEMTDRDAVAHGESSLNVMESRASSLSSADGECWKTALIDLKSECKSMTETEQRLMGLRFANCHIERSGLETFPCTAADFKTCTRDMAQRSPLAFNAYTEFFGKVIDICHYLKSDMWMEKTRDTVSKLAKTSSDVVDKLEISSEKQDLLLSVQHVSIKNQEKILTSELGIHQAILESGKAAEKEFADAKQRAEEKAKWLDASFDKTFSYLNRISGMFDALFNHFSIVQCTAFYLFSLFFWMFACSSQSVASARFFVCGGLFLSCFLEMALVFSSKMTERAVWIDIGVWQLRGMSYLVCFASCLYHWLTGHSGSSQTVAWKENKDELQFLSKQIEMLRTRLDSNKHDVSKVVNHWSHGGQGGSSFVDGADSILAEVAGAARGAVHKPNPVSCSTPKKMKNERRKQLFDSGIENELNDGDATCALRSSDLEKRPTKNESTSVRRKRSTILQRLGNSQDQSWNNSLNGSHSYNLRSRKSLIPHGDDICP